MSSTPPLAAVTGATGFLGAILVDELLATQRVRCLVRSRTARPSGRGMRGCDLVQGDLGNAVALDALVTGADVVYHCAATMEKADPERSRQVNVEGTARLVRAAHAAGVRRFVYVSSTSVYVATPARGGVRTEAMEPTNIPALNNYSRTKYEGELVVRQLGADLGLPFTIVRPTNIYGVRSGPWFRQWVTRLARVPIAFGGVAIDLVYVNDVATALIQAGQAAAAAGETFNLGHEMVPMRRFAVEVGKVTGRRTYTLPAAVDRLLSRAIDAGFRFATGSRLSPSLVEAAHYPHAKARRLFGYAPRFPIDAAFADLGRQYHVRAAE